PLTEANAIEGVTAAPALPLASAEAGTASAATTIAVEMSAPPKRPLPWRRVEAAVEPACMAANLLPPGDRGTSWVAPQPGAPEAASATRPTERETAPSPVALRPRVTPGLPL